MGRNKNSYNSSLIAMMSYLDNVKHDKNKTFTNERLAQLTAADVARYFNFRVFNTPEPGPDDRPCYRSTTVAYWKKAISKFMPNRLPQWNPITMSGNPTKSQELADLLARIKKAEVRKQGVESQACRALTENEFRQALRILRQDPQYGPLVSYGVVAFSIFQSHMIGRVDCISQWKAESFEKHTIYPDIAARARLPWSKNVRQEGDAPWQLIIGSRDPQLCVLIALAIWLEFYLSNYKGLSPYVFALNADYRIPEGGDKINDFVQRKMRDVYRRDDFQPDDDRQKLGTHSVRKYANTRARRLGARPDEADYRGRWKNDRRVSTVCYTEELPWVDAKVASYLCIGGACSYRIKQQSEITDDWICEHVTPSIATSASYGRVLATLLGKALLWVTFSDHSEWVPPAIRIRIKEAYEGVLGTEVADNPVEKHMLVLTGEEEMVTITEVSATATPTHDVAETAGPGNNIGQLVQGQQTLGTGHLDTFANRQLLQAMMSQMNNLQASMASLTEEMREAREVNRLAMEGHFRIVNQNLRWIQRHPLRLMQRAANQHHGEQQLRNGGAVRPILRAELSPTPKTLYDLWEEWTKGIGGRKPACQFTPQERGKKEVKHKFCRRKIVWARISLLVNAGYSAQVACDKIYDAYGQSTTVTQIINRMKEDKAQGRVPESLQVN